MDPLLALFLLPWVLWIVHLIVMHLRWEGRCNASMIRGWKQGMSDARRRA